MKMLFAAALLAVAAPAMAQDMQSGSTSTTTTTTTTTGDMQSQPAAGSTGMDASAQGGMSGQSGASAGGAMAGGEMPTCSATVRDRCVQPAAAERVAAAEYKGGGKDNSAMMGGKRPARKRRG